MTDLLWTRPDGEVLATVVLAHGAGAAMDSPFMTKMAANLAEAGLAVARFEFAYMAGRRNGGPKKAPPKAEQLIGEFQTVVQQVLKECEGPLLIGGKSMGGRVAAMLAGGGSLPGRIKGVICLGYPFHPTGKPEPEHWRLVPLEQGKRPILVLQGDRDGFGSQEEIDAITLPAAVTLHYLEDGNHDFAPRGRSPATLDGNLAIAAGQIRSFADTILS